MNHGEQALVPLNYLLIVANALMWAFLLPVWATVVVVVPIAGLLWYYGRDPYGGMHLSLLVLLGLFAGAMAFEAVSKHAEESGQAMQFLPTALIVVGGVVGFIVFMLLGMALILAIAIGWETLRDRWRPKK